MSHSAELIRRLPFAWRITRYDRAYRDSRGAYTIDTWTSVTDVGKVFEGRELTLEEYERTEAAYIETFVVFAREANIERVQVREFPRLEGEPQKDGAVVPIDEATEILRAMLREEAECRLEAPGNDFYVHAGYDLCMYIGAASSCSQAVVYAEELGLFVDPDWPSPYLPD